MIAHIALVLRHNCFIYNGWFESQKQNPTQPPFAKGGAFLFWRSQNSPLLSKRSTR
jgi:hypothetical protein